MFRPFAQLSEAPMTLVIRTKRDPSAAVSDVRREIRTVDRNAALEFSPYARQWQIPSSGPAISFLVFAVFAMTP